MRNARNMVIVAFISSVILFARPAFSDAGPTLDDATRRALTCSQSGAKGLAFRSAENLVCITGQITKDMAITFIDMKIPTDVWLVVNSGGGDAEAALDIAEKIERLDATLVVNNLCFSACANYLFIAAKYKFVLPKSMLGWHGGPPHSPPPIVKPERREFVRQLARRSDAFFDRRGVSTDLIYFPPYKDNGEIDRSKAAWSVPRSKLEELYGVTGIVSMWEVSPADFPEGSAGTMRMLFPSP